jgi:Kef-type K+ transport system membrane component KefB
MSMWYKKMVLGLFVAVANSMDASYDGGLAVPAQLLISSGLNTLFIAKFALFVSIFLAGVIIIGYLLNLFVRMPIIAGQIMGGIFLGPSGVNLANISFFRAPLELIDRSSGLVYALVSSDLFIFFLLLLSAAFTVSYLLWLAGHETDVRDIAKIGIMPVVAGFLGAVLPIFFIGLFLYYIFGTTWSLVEALSTSLVFAATSVSIPIAMLLTYNKMHLRSSKATLGAAIVDDILAVILLSGFFACAQTGLLGDVPSNVQNSHSGSLVQVFLYMVFGFILFCLIGYYTIPPFMRYLYAKKLHTMMPSFALVIMLGSFACVELCAGLAGITGAYFAGLFHRLGDVRHTVEKTVAPFVNAILIPLFLGSIGFQVDVTLLSLFDWGVVCIILLLAIVSKMIGCFVAVFVSNMLSNNRFQWRGIETYLFGSAMVARGEVGLVVATILYGAGFLLTNQYVISIVVIVLTTVVASIMLSIGFWHEELYGHDVHYEELVTRDLGLFPIIGTVQMFNIIIGYLKTLGLYSKSHVTTTDGRQLINIEHKQVCISMEPGKGIIFEGRASEVNRIIDAVKRAINEDLETI